MLGRNGSDKGTNVSTCVLIKTDFSTKTINITDDRVSPFGPRELHI